MILLKDILREYRDQQIVFVTGTADTGITYDSQKDAGKTAIQNRGYQNIKVFNGDTELAEDGASLYDFLEVNNVNVHRVILFSLSCQYANRVAGIVGAAKVYCIEPWSCPGKDSTVSGVSKTSADQIPADHFYVHKEYCGRGNGAQKNIPDSNFTPSGTGHVEALSWAIGNIL